MTAAAPARPDAAMLIRAGTAVPAAPWTRHVLSQPGWADLAERLQDDPLTLVTLWSDGAAVHALFLEGQDRPLLASVLVDAQRYLALSPARPAIAVCERMIRDLWGIEAMAARDLRPWLDHGAWGLTAPLAARPGPAAWPPEPPDFTLAPEDAAVDAFQLGIGPVQAVSGGPAHLHLTLDGEQIRRLELLLGYAHRGILRAIRGRTPQEAAGLVARIDAETTVAHQSAFARAVEAATGRSIDPRTAAWRLAMGELERIAVHLHHLARTARAAALDDSVPGRLRELLLQACEAAFGHRLMMGAIVPGTPAPALTEAGLAALLTALDRIEAALPGARRSLLGRAAARRLSGGRLPAGAVADGLGGPAGRASGRFVDVRRLVGLPKAEDLLPARAPGTQTPGAWAGSAQAEGAQAGDGQAGDGRAGDGQSRTARASYGRAGDPPAGASGIEAQAGAATAGDARARCRARLDEIAAAIPLLRRLLLPDRAQAGEAARDVPAPASSEGIGVAESAHGPVWHWLRMEDGRIVAMHVHDPTLPLWLALEQAAVGLGVDELALLCASLAPSAPGADL